MSGRFIVLEGLDGSGTTTQCELLAARLQEHGLPVELTKEPTDGPIGALLREAIEGRVRLEPTSLALAFAADRAHHLFNEEDGIVKRLREGSGVVCDRYVLSSLAYQPDGAIERGWVEQVNSFAIEPDLTIFLDASPEVCVERIAARSDKPELFEDVEQLTRVRENYRAAIAQRPHVKTIDAHGSVEEVAHHVWAAVATP